MKIGDLICRDVSYLDMDVLKDTIAQGYAVVVPDETPALAVAEIADTARTPLIVVTARTEGIAGVTSPRWLVGQYASHGFRVQDTLYKTLADIARDADERAKNFHHEFLNYQRVQLYLCRGGHYTSLQPCPRHP